MSGRILIVDDDESLRESLQLVLSAEGYEAVCAADAEAALRQLEISTPELVLCDLRMPGMDGLELLPQLVRRLPEATVILMSAYGTAELAIEAMKRGAYDYLAKPFAPSEVLLALRKARERERLRRANQLLRREVERASGEHPIVAASEPMIEVLEVMERAAGFKATVLLTGESGTGKEVLARAIHAQSPAPGRGLRRGELRGDPGGAARERALRARQGRLHGRRPRAPRPLRGGRRRNAVPRRGGRAAHGAAGQALARAPGGGGAAAGRLEVPEGRRAGARRHRAQSRGRGRGGPLPRGSLLPPQRGPARGAAAARAPEGHPAAGRSLPGPLPGHARQAGPRDLRRSARAIGGVPLAGQRARARERDRARHHPGQRRPDRPLRAAAERGRAPAGGGPPPAAPATSRCAAPGGWSKSR